MKIAVCMKQVPAVTEGDMDMETGVLIRAGLHTVPNVYDLAALEAALRIKDRHDASIHVFTMGPEKAEAILREAFAMGADSGYLVSDPAFGGADVLATSYTLMQALKAIGSYDLIFCGRQTTDGDTAQVSGALAGWLSIPHINWVHKVNADEFHKEEKVQVTYHMEQGNVRAEVMLPCLLSVEKEAFIPRMPSLKLKISGKKKAVHRIRLKDLNDQDAGHYGLAGSATRVRKIYPPKRTVRRNRVNLNAEDAADYILDILRPDGVVSNDL